MEFGGPSRSQEQQREMRCRGRQDQACLPDRLQCQRLGVCVQSTKSKRKVQRNLQRMARAKEDIYEPGRCAVCFDNVVNVDNPMIHCDRCEIDVHVACYGVLPAVDGSGNATYQACPHTSSCRHGCAVAAPPAPTTPPAHYALDEAAPSRRVPCLTTCLDVCVCVCVANH